LDVIVIDPQADDPSLWIKITSSGSSASNLSSRSLIIQPPADNEVSLDARLVMRFRLKNLDALATPGTEVKMTATVTDKTGTFSADKPTSDENVASVVSSSRASLIELNSVDGKAYVNVDDSSLSFTGTQTNEGNTAVLGQIVLGSAGDDFLNGKHLPWTFGEDEPLPNSALLKIDQGNFKASQAEPGMVFLDVDGNMEYDEGVDIKADDVNDDDLTAEYAQWTLSDLEISDMADDDGVTNVVIMADGETEINDFRDAPEASLKITYGGGYEDPFSGRFRHIKRNGTVCTLYNIPNPTAVDLLSVRIINKTDEAGRVIGTLRDYTGLNVFTNKTLVDSLAANATVRLGETDSVSSDVFLDGIEKDTAWVEANPGKTTWDERATLQINSSIDDLGVFGLVRNRKGGPLTNMSFGANYNCEDEK